MSTPVFKDNFKRRGRAKIEFLNGEKVYTISSAESGKGYFCGKVYFPKELIGKKISISIIPKEEYKNIIVEERIYSKSLKGVKNERY